MTSTQTVRYINYRIANTKGGFFGKLFLLLNDDSRLDYETNFTENTVGLLQKY